MSEGYAINSQSSATKDIQLQNLYLQDIGEARQLLSKDQSDRSKQDLSRLRELLCPKLSYLSTLLQHNKTWILDQLFKFIQYRVYQQGQLVCQIGEKSLEFYLILQGECSVQIPLPVPINIKQKKQNEENTSPKDSSSDEQQHYQMQCSPVQTAMVEVKTLSSGMSFGERGLIENRGRTATIAPKGEVHILILKKEAFMRILGTYEENKLAQIVNLLYDIDFFKGWGRGSLKWIYYNVLVKKCNLDEYIFQQGQPSDNMYIIIHGDFILSKQYTISNSLQPSNKTSQIYLKKCKNSKYFISKTIDISLLSQNEVFGEEDLFLQQNRSYSIRSLTQDSILWVISKKIFTVKVLQNQYSVQYLENNSKKKIERYEKGFERQLENEKNSIIERKKNTSPERIQQYQECFTQKAEIENEKQKFEKEKEAKLIPNSLTSTNNYQYINIDYDQQQQQQQQQQLNQSDSFDSLTNASPQSKRINLKQAIKLQRRSKQIQRDSSSQMASFNQIPSLQSIQNSPLSKRQSSPSTQQGYLQNKMSKEEIQDQTVIQNINYQHHTISMFNKPLSRSILPQIGQTTQMNYDQKQEFRTEEDIKRNNKAELKSQDMKRKFYRETDNNLIANIISIQNKDKQKRTDNKQVLQLNQIFNKLQYDKDMFSQNLTQQQRIIKDIKFENNNISNKCQPLLKGDYMCTEIKFNGKELQQGLCDANIIQQKRRSRSQQASPPNTYCKTQPIVSFSKNGRKNQFDNQFLFSLN